MKDLMAHKTDFSELVPGDVLEQTQHKHKMLVMDVTKRINAQGIDMLNFVLFDSDMFRCIYQSYQVREKLYWYGFWHT